MRRMKRSGILSEKVIMIACSALLLTALTSAGLYMKAQNRQMGNDGYVIDFAQMEGNVEDKYEEIARAQTNQKPRPEPNPKVTMEAMFETESMSDSPDKQISVEDKEQEGVALIEPATPDLEENTPEESVSVSTKKVEAVLEQKPLSIRLPAIGEVILPFSMDKSIYFETLDQYRYHPGIVYRATVGQEVTACAEGTVAGIAESARYGTCVVLDLGDGYQATYGQLSDVYKQEGEHIMQGEAIGTVGEPTNYYAVEGCNLYFELKKDGEAVDPTAFSCNM